MNIDEELKQINCHDKLLDLWEEKFPTEVHFNKDGIISKEHWEKSDVKVLFILKETNNARQNIVDAISRALTTTSSGWWKGKVLRRVGRMAHGLTNYTGEVPNFNDAKLHGKNSTWNIAYINMRKTAGGPKTNKISFNRHVEEYAPYIRKQIELINPTIVVLGGTFKQLKKYIYPDLSHVSERIHQHENIIFINTFHPASRTSAEGLYHQALDSYHNYRIKLNKSADAL